MKVTERQDRSWLMAMLQFLINPCGALISKPGKPSPGGSPRLKIHSSVSKTCNTNERQVDDIWIYDMAGRSVSADDLDATKQMKHRNKRIYYIAGGSFCMPPSSDHWKFCATLAKSIPDVVVSIISPPLAPNCPAPDTFPQLTGLFKTLLIQAEQKHESVSFAGDSSGANLILTVVLNTLQQCPGLKAPESLLLISPVVDLSFTNPEIKQVEKCDPVLRLHIEVATAQSWGATWDLKDPRLSPLYADLSILARRDVKVHGLLGGNDLLSPDALKFQHLCDQVGVDGEWLVWQKQMHCFPLAFHYCLPESIEGKDWVVDVLSRHAMHDDILHGGSG